MKFEELDPPRIFKVGRTEAISLKDCGRIYLSTDEQVTFVTEDGKEYDVVKKEWGFYALPSTNGRLKKFGLRAALVLSETGKLFVFLAEEGKVESLDQYLKSEKIKILTWLDSDGDVSLLNNLLSQKGSQEQCAFCGDGSLKQEIIYHARPQGETDFHIPEKKYHRSYLKCTTCGHYLAELSPEISLGYTGQYAEATYGGQLQSRFEKIISLPPERSDNFHRVERVFGFVSNKYKALDKSAAAFSVLDIGSGLCVFLYKLHEKTGWRCVALDPDPNQSAHASQLKGIQAVKADFMKSIFAEGFGQFQLITLNKVLEHVLDPVEMLRRTKDFLTPDGTVYIELPDGESAICQGQDREEFFIDHLHVFSFSSACLLAQKAGFEVERAERVVEPSTKFTLCLFLRPKE